MIEKLYTVEEVAELASVTGRTIRNYLKSGRLVGRKIGGQWRFPEAEVQRLLSGAPPEPRAAEPAPTESVIETADRQTDPPEGEGYGAPVEAHGEHTDDTGADSMEYAEAYAYAPAEGAAYPGPYDGAPYAQPTQPEPAAAPPQQVATPVQAQPVPYAYSGPAPALQPALAAQATPCPPPQQPPGWPQQPAYAQPALPPDPLPPPQAPPQQAAYPQPGYEAPPPYAYTVRPTIPAASPPSPSAGGYYAQAAPRPVAEPQPVADPAARPAAERDAAEDLTQGFSEVGRKVARFVAEVHDCSDGPVVCSVVDAYQTLDAARHASERLSEVAEEESEHGTLCQAFVEYDDRYFVARYTLFGTSSFLQRCLTMIG